MNVKTFLKLLVAIVLIAAFILIISSLSKTKPSSPGTLGNTAGNIYNGGLFCENDGYIYFSNFSDDGNLYRMTTHFTDFKKLHNDKTAYINADENYIYYVRQNYKRITADTLFKAYACGICRLNKDGSKFKSITSDYAHMTVLYDNNIYFQKCDTSSVPRLFRISIAGNAEYFMSEEAIKPAAFYDDSLLYSGISEDHNIRVLDFNGYDGGILNKESSYMPIYSSCPNGSVYIYYISVEDNYSLCRITPDGTGKETLIRDFCSNYNISNDGRYLFFQTDNDSRHTISILDLTTMNRTIILEGDYKQLHVTSEYLFFTEFDDSKTYAYKITDGSLNIFNPPVIE